MIDYEYSVLIHNRQNESDPHVASLIYTLNGINGPWFEMVRGEPGYCDEILDALYYQKEGRATQNLDIDEYRNMVVALRADNSLEILDEGTPMQTISRNSLKSIIDKQNEINDKAKYYLNIIKNYVLREKEYQDSWIEEDDFIEISNAYKESMRLLFKAAEGE